jgi:hypothetical protein
LAVALARHPIVYLIAWAIMGAGMRMTLYDAAFAALVQVTPNGGAAGDLVSHPVWRLRFDAFLADRIYARR